MSIVRHFSLFVLLNLCCLNTIFGQNVASEFKIFLNWGKNNVNNEYPICSNYDISYSINSNFKVPITSHSIYTPYKNEIQIVNLITEVLNFQKNTLDKFKKELKSELVYSYNHTLEGNKGVLILNFCPYIIRSNQIHKVISFDVKLIQTNETILSPVFNQKRRLINSVLATGQWYKFAVSESGFYKIDINMLRNLGINISNLNPKTIKIYGHHGGMLPEKNSDFRHEDLAENSIRVVGEDDGVFNDNDYVLFYALGPHQWKYSFDQNISRFSTNIYSDKSYFFLTFGGDNGKRISENSNGTNLTPTQSYNQFNDYRSVENEIENICKEGRVVFGEKFSQKLNHTFDFSFPDFVNNSNVRLIYRVAAVSQLDTRFDVSVNGNQVHSLFINRIFENQCYRLNTGQTQFPITNSNLSVNFSYTRDLPSSVGYLDFFELHVLRKLDFQSEINSFRNYASANQSVPEFILENWNNNWEVFNVTDPVNLKKQNLFPSGQNSLFRYQNQGNLHEFVVFKGVTKTPEFVENVANQNLHAIDLAEFIIVSHPDFITAANQLADFHKTRDNMSVVVVTPQQIYNEFSSGSQDICAIRDFLKTVYYNNTNPANQLKYCMLFGDASFDYKDKIANNSNFVPTYESFEPNYCSDDFYGFLDPTDGEWILPQKLEIGISRVPAINSTEASRFVEKVKTYKSMESLGRWRNKLTLLGDDFDKDWEPFYFLDDFEQISRFLDTAQPQYRQIKLYADAFKQQNLGGSQRYPDLQLEILNEFNNGSFLINYIGHGGPAYIADEKIFDIPMINSIDNMKNLPVFFTATCSFSGYDDATIRTAGEQLMMNNNGGVIANFTTTRTVGAQDNSVLTKYFWYECLFRKQGGQYLRLGDIYKLLKNRPSSSFNDRLFTLFADPALRLNYPSYDIVIDTIKDIISNIEIDTIGALSKVNFKGRIVDNNGNTVNDFNGLVFPTLFDKKAKFQTLGNDALKIIRPFENFSNILYNGEGSVINGQFNFTCVIPKDIAYNFGTGKLILYAQNSNSDFDATGYRLVTVGGASSNSTNDREGPKIELFVDDYKFVSGGLAKPTPLLLARIFDENGINAGNGIGRDIVATIDKGTPNEKSYVVNQYYKTRLDSYTDGEMSYQLSLLPPGKHTYTLKVWDSYNNSSEATIEFVISDNQKLVITNLFNYPNPFSTQTMFMFDHNNQGSDLDVVINIISISGKVVKSIEAKIYNSPSHVENIYWNGKDEYDDKLAKGVYIYSIIVKNDKGERVEKKEKLVILN